MDNQSSAFKELQAKWYEKLKKSGFDDVEDAQGGLDRSRSQNTEYYQAYTRGYDLSIKSDVSRYYELAGQFLHEHTFLDSWHKKIWEMHSEGMSIREITTEVRTRRTTGCSKDYVQKVLKPLIAEMLKQNRESDE